MSALAAGSTVPTMVGIGSSRAKILSSLLWEHRKPPTNESLRPSWLAEIRKPTCQNTSKIHPSCGNILAEARDTRATRVRPSFVSWGVRAPSTGVAMTEVEKNVNPFGTVASDCLIYNVQKGWFTQSSQKEILLENVADVKLEIRRYWFFGISFLLIALTCRMLDSAWTLIAIVPLSLAVILLWGLPSVRVYTTDEGVLPSPAKPPWTRHEAEWFVAAVNQRRQ
jgi:hypothetical protein